MASSTAAGGELRIVMIGKTGVGKSAVGNTIFGENNLKINEKTFKSVLSSNSTTTSCEKTTKMVNNRSISIIDTPGLLDTKMTQEALTKEIGKCIKLAGACGPHVFLLIMSTTRFTPEEKNSVEALQELFGTQSDKYMIVLFTRGDDLEEEGVTIQEFVREANPDLLKLIQRVGGRFHAFNNKSKDKKQVDELIKMIDAMILVNGGSSYTNELFKETHKDTFFKDLLQRVKRFMVKLVSF